MKPKSGSKRLAVLKKLFRKRAGTCRVKKRVEQPSISRSDWPRPVAEESVGRVIPDRGRSFSADVMSSHFWVLYPLETVLHLRTAKYA